MSASTDQLNGGWAGEFGRHVPWEIFDRLPWAVREVYCFAAYNYTPERAVRALEKGAEVQDLVQFLRSGMRRRMRAEVLRLYGPEHPQAAR